MEANPRQHRLAVCPPACDPARVYERWHGGWLRFRALAVTGYAVAVVITAFIGPESWNWPGALVAVFGPLIYLAVSSFSVGKHYDRLVRRSRPLGDELFGRVPAGALRASGLRNLEIREDGGRLRTMGRTVRHRRRAVLVLPAAWRALPDDVMDGLLLHETAHLIRDDADRTKWTIGLLVAFLALGLPDSTPRPLAFALVLVAFLVVIAHNWWQECAADAFVAEHGGPGPADGFARYLDAAERSPWQEVRGRLTHPPDTWRVQRLRSSASGDDAAAQHGALR